MGPTGTSIYDPTGRVKWMYCLPFAASGNGEGNDDEEIGWGGVGPNGLPHSRYLIVFYTILYYFI
jgi:hypothetical protein